MKNHDKGTKHMLKKIILTLSLSVCSLISLADQLKINDDAPKTLGYFSYFLRATMVVA
jgi:hypothetical protein